MKKLLFFLIALFSLAESSLAQCNFDPTVTGDVVLCPNATGILKTQEYDSYQWYRKPYSSDIPELITGATGQSLAVTQDDVLYYFWVEVTLNGCTEASPEILLDGYVFLLPFVQHDGNYIFDPEMEAFKVCEGDTMFLTLGAPYDTNITWYKNQEPIAGAVSPTLAVTESGAYTVEGAPSVCPDYIQPLGLSLPVIVEACATDVKPGPNDLNLSVYPNPTSGLINLEMTNDQLFERVTLTDVSGRQLREWTPNMAGRIALSVEDFAAGFYWLKITAGGRTAVRKVVIH